MTKNEKVILLKKFFAILISFSLFLLVSLIGVYNFYSTSFKYFSSHLSLFTNFDFTFCLDFSSLTFLFIVFLVTSLVSLYREIYMEYYNNKKFFILIFFFFISIVFLSLRGSSLILFLG